MAFYTGNSSKIVSSSFLFTTIQNLYTKIKGIMDGKADKEHSHNYLPLSGGDITCDSNNTTYGKAAINIWNKTNSSSTIYPSIAFAQTGISDANIVMKNRQFYRKTSTDEKYYKIYDESDTVFNGKAKDADTVDGFHVSTLTGNYLRPINYGTTALTPGFSSLETGNIYLQYE